MNNKKIKLSGSPENAYNVMKYLSLGVSNTDLRQVPVGEVQ